MFYKCDLCNGLMETDEDLSKDEFVVCPHCGIETRIVPTEPPAPPQNEQPNIVTAPTVTSHITQDISKQTPTATDLSKAEQLHLQATFRLMKCQAHYSVYSSHLKKVAYDGLEFVDEALRLFPNNPSYLNTKALLLADGLGDMEQSIQILKRTSAIVPDDIQLRQNLRDATEQQEDSRTITVIAVIVFFFIIVGAIIYIVNNS